MNTTVLGPMSIGPHKLDSKGKKATPGRSTVLSSCHWSAQGKSMKHSLRVALLVATVISILETFNQLILLHSAAPSSPEAIFPDDNVLLQPKKKLFTRRRNQKQKAQRIKAQRAKAQRRIKETSAHPDTAIEITQHREPRFCYAFLIGGVHENNPGYRGFLYNAMIATRILRNHNSTADVQLMIQFSSNSQWDAIPEDAAVRSLGIQIRYLAKPQNPLSFADIQLQKFKVLQWTQYDRVLFLDADIMPLKSLDYLFELSMEGIIKENVGVATRGEPANGGFWMIKPQKGDIQQMEKILEQYAEPFDRKIGWGHSFAKEKDKWESTVSRWMPRWRFWAAHLDQGLLYYWIKYHKKNVTLIIGDRVQNWDLHKNGTLIMETEQIGLLDNYTKADPVYAPKVPEKGMEFLMEAPYRDYVHYVGSLKPWLGPIPGRLGSANVDLYHAKRARRQLWFTIFSELNTELNLGYDLSNWGEEQKKLQQPPLGLSDSANVNEGRFTTFKISDDDIASAG